MPSFGKKLRSKIFGRENRDKAMDFGSAIAGGDVLHPSAEEEVVSGIRPHGRNSQETTGMFHFTDKTPTAEQTIDLVGIHGLQGNYDSTWTDKNTNQNWLRHFLPDELPQLRIMAYGYNSKVLGSKSVGTVTTFAQGLLADLKACRRRELSDRPLIFVCHSLGGLVFKRMLALAQERTDLYRHILQATRGVLFLGTPHDGSGIASMLSLPAKMAKVLSHGNTNSELVENLQAQKGSLLELSESFTERGARLDKIYSFYEEEKLYGSLVVSKGSARIGVNNEELISMACNHSTISKFPGSDNHQYQRILSTLVELVDIISAGKNSVSEAQLNEVVESLQQYGSNPRRHKISKEYQETFRWIWDPNLETGPGFLHWLQFGSEIFWIAGKPGAGKSTLMKYIIESEKTLECLRMQTQQAKIMSFYFAEQGERQEKAFGDFLRSFLFQLVRAFPALVYEALPIYREMREFSAMVSPFELNWTDIDTKRALELISKQDSVHGHVCLFIDGLDECEGGAMDTEDIDYIVGLQKWKAVSIKICIASRPDLPIKLRLNKFQQLRVQEWTSGDIAKFVLVELQTSFELVNSGTASEEDSRELDNLSRSLVHRAQGVFLWVKLVIKDLKAGIEQYVSYSDLRMRLESLPEGINALYGAIFAKISSKDLHHAINALQAQLLTDRIG
ncbi:hypothetical protein VTL71DRAFT_2206 [Oculimacula yallundae]|uniref:NACHT domain-containing protein n=1 Tax=Oculimacula yallundae TaxID=86028 RepID=A0ABR4C890_9HELO